jgi:hypothetical protein
LIGFGFTTFFTVAFFGITVFFALAITISLTKYNIL